MRPSGARPPPAAPGPSLHRSVQGSIGVLRLNRPAVRNALDADIITGIDDALRSAVNDGLRAVVLIGEGDLAFSAGMDLRAFAEGSRSVEVEAKQAFDRIVRQPHEVPLIAAVNGAALGGGFELVLACDLVIAADHATFALPEARRGIFPAGGGTMLATRIPHCRAMALMLTGENMPAAEAERLGLVNEVVPRDTLLTSVMALATRVAETAPLAARAITRLTRQAREVGIANTWADVDETSARVQASEDAREGVHAFLEKRPAVWTGR